MYIDFGREICGDFEAGGQREWLVTNGIGGFASGTVAGHLGRRYHGLLFAALQPPLGRTLLASKIEESAEYDGDSFLLSTNAWASGVIEPRGYRQIERFHLEGTVPVWTFALADALLEKRIWMQQGANTTYVRYDLARSSAPIKLGLRVLVNYRDYHGITRAGDPGSEWRMHIEPCLHGVSVLAWTGATPFYLMSAESAAAPQHEWYRDFALFRERERGLASGEDHLYAARFEVSLKQGSSVTVALSTDRYVSLNGAAELAAQLGHERSLLDSFAASSQAANSAPAWIRQLVLAADQFIVKRPLTNDAEALTVIAGYPWFGDWGRDTMIALPGLALSTGRPEIAARVLRTFAHFLKQGLVPNRFPDQGDKPEYNTVDAALWYFEALRQYYAFTRDRELVKSLFPVLSEIVEWHTSGTTHNIHVDPSDGLLYAGEAGVQVTWMDAKVGDGVVTPRIGKPVEVNALWYNALLTMARFAAALGYPSDRFELMATKARQGFARFWNGARGYCFDVLDGPQGNDPALRPNQVFAVSLAESPFDAGKQKSVLDACARHLLTSHGLRSLTSHDNQYHGRYSGDRIQRDSAYHQGTVWAWLLGPFVLAHLRVYRDSELAASFLAPMAHHLEAYGLGSVGEIFDGDPPFTPRGCIAQAWSVGEVLRAYSAITAFSGVVSGDETRL